MANANFTPDIGPYTTLKPFRFWCQKVLPLVYDDSLSYYELLGKVVDYLNKTMEDVDTQITDIQGLLSAYEALQGWVNHYYDSADFEAAIDAGLDRMAADGRLDALIAPVITDQLPALVNTLLPGEVENQLPGEVASQIGLYVEDQLPGVVSNQIGGTVANQLPAVVSNQIPGTVANQLPAVVSNQIGPVVEDKIVDPVEDWLDANVSSGIAVDRTLSVLGAGADAAFTGARLEKLDGMLGYEHVSDTGSFITTPNPYAFNYEFINENANFSDLASHTYKMIVIPVTTGDKYCINAHKISITNANENHFAVTYAFCAKHIGDPQTDIPYYLPTTYSTDDAENVIATVPEINIPTGQYYDETTGYLVVITANIEDPVYKVTGSDFATVDYVDDEIDAVNEAVEGLEADLAGKADTDGTYPYLTAGSAQQLTSDQVVTDQKPYLFRRTPADATREFDTLVGGSVVANQLVQNGNFADGTTGWSVQNAGNGSIAAASNELTYTIINPVSNAYGNCVKQAIATIASHKYLFIQDAYVPKPATVNEIYLSSNRTVDIPSGWSHIEALGNASASENNVYFGLADASGKGFVADDVYKLKNINVIDLTAMFGSAIADYAYTLEQATSGSGIAWLKSYGFFAGYQAYNAGSMVHVSGVEAHVMKDANDNIIGDYTLDDTLTLRGIPKLSNGEIYYDGDTYAHDGTVTRNYGIRAYQAGDESLTNAITDGTNTVYKLTSPTTESAAPYQTPQICDPDGTEQYVTDGIPVGHKTEYPANLKGALERIMIQVPAAPAAAGTYVLTCTVDSSGSASYEWAASTGRTLGAIRPVDQIQDQIREPAADTDEIRDAEINPDDIQDTETDPERDPDEIQDVTTDPE